jgi:DnaJ-class molecular chaperone
VCPRDHINYTSCGHCNGTGDDPRSELVNFSLRQWNQDFLSRRVYKYFGSNCLDEMEERDSLILDDGRMLRVGRCPKCKSSPKGSPCSLCNEKRIIRVQIYSRIACPMCDGAGIIKYDECKKCEGTGNVCCHCGGEGELDCSECDGTGLEEGIISIKV